jgi:large subunit ribosomal protein L4
MASITLKTPAGKDAGSLELSADVFGIQPNVPVMHQVVTAQLAARRSGTQSTKTRAEVRGGGKKPFKQKGTGNARQGSIRAPHYSGGGVALGPKPRKYDQKTPKKMIKLALRSALSDRAAEGKVVVVDSWGFDAPKTKEAKNVLNKLGIDGKALVVVDIDDANTIKSFMNLPNVQLCERAELNAYDVLCADYVVFSQSTLPTGEGAAEVVEAKPAKKTAAKKTAEPAAKKTAGDTAADRPAATRAAAADDLTNPGETGNDDDSSPYPGAVKSTGDEMPEGYEIKGNAQSMKYHVPGSRYYKATKAEYWFDSVESAETAGFSAPGGSAADDAGDES